MVLIEGISKNIYLKTLHRYPKLILTAVNSAIN